MGEEFFYDSKPNEARTILLQTLREFRMGGWPGPCKEMLNLLIKCSKMLDNTKELILYMMEYSILLLHSNPEKAVLFATQAVSYL